MALEQDPTAGLRLAVALAQWWLLRRSLALAQELGYPAGQALALALLGCVALSADDRDSAVQLFRQAQQIPADSPGMAARDRSLFLTRMLTYIGDLTAARRVCAAQLVRCRDAGDLWNLARLLNRMAILEVQAGRFEDAAAQLRESLQTAVRTGSRIEVLNGLDGCGDLCAAAEYALMLAAPGPRRPQVQPGQGELSARERELVTLVAQGRTNTQIASQLYISVRTVSSHLDRIRDKTGCHRRADLTRLALSEGLI